MKSAQLENGQQGFTLIEIMIAMTLGLFLIGGVLTIFLSSKQSYRMQENLSRMQENGRFAIEFLSRDLRMAGYWGCVKPSDIENKLNNDATFDPFANTISAVNNDSDNSNSIVNGTDAITMRGAAGLGVNIENQPTATNASLKIVNNSGLAVNEIVVISNCVAGDIFQITNITGSGGFDNVIHNTGSATPGNNSSYLEVGPEPSPASPQANKYGPDAEILKLTFFSYQLQTGASGQPSLFRNINGGTFQELVENIENMQILYGEDTDNDNTPNYYVPAGTAGLNMSQVVSVRISLLAVSADDNLTSQPIPYTYNGATTTPTDRRLRRVFTSTIVLRNRL